MKDIGRKAERQVIQMHWNTPNLIAPDLAIFSLEVLSAINVTISSTRGQFTKRKSRGLRFWQSQKRHPYYTGASFLLRLPPLIGLPDRSVPDALD
jgi:hypothetical protein